MQEFKPSLTRFFIAQAAAAAIGGGIMYLMLNVIDSNSSLGYIPWLGVYVAGMLIGVRLRAASIIDDLSVKIVGDSIVGASDSLLWGIKRVSFPLQTIDLNRTRRQNILHKVLSKRYIYSTTGEKIYLHTLAFGKGQINTILTQIGCQP